MPVGLTNTELVLTKRVGPEAARPVAEGATTWVFTGPAKRAATWVHATPVARSPIFSISPPKKCCATNAQMTAGAIRFSHLRFNHLDAMLVSLASILQHARSSFHRATLLVNRAHYREVQAWKRE